MSDNKEGVFHKVYNSDDIFEDIPEAPDFVMMKIPDEIIEKMGWEPGDTLSIEVEDGAIILTKVVK